MSSQWLTENILHDYHDTEQETTSMTHDAKTKTVFELFHLIKSMSDI